MEQAGATMAEVVASVKRVTDIVGEISSASQEQSEGIEQVNRAIAQMDETTQQNAALVEQAAAAAQSLQDQAATLTQVVGIFTLDSAHTASKNVAVAQVKPAVMVSTAATTKSASHKPAPGLVKSTAKTAVSTPAATPKRLPAATSDDDWEQF